ncbi:hypothetical protein [Methylobacterium organophilum]|uniref:Uncharacterized protein n=1 Tax=Methylobacterium organophilum TaxID=410 RepID=A0ABQ4TAS6_METOR|nr:hypothetical protein [Methylobacterium organophilum]GJE28136.1 hypothetical protein LKMONMHP_3003 [Methylobacterium organophilum]
MTTAVPTTWPTRGAPAVAPLSVRVAGASLILTGPLTGRLACGPALPNFLNRCLRIERLEGLRFDLTAARIELRFSGPVAASGEDMHHLARIMREAGQRESLRSAAFLRHVSERIWEEPVTLWRSGPSLSTWRVHHLGSGRVRLSHGVLRDRTALAIVASFLKRRGAVIAVDRHSATRGFLDLRCDPSGLPHLVAEAESIEAILRRRVVTPFSNPEVKGLLINANLAFAIGAAMVPALMPISAVVLAAASWPTARQALRQLRQRRADATAILTILSALALINGDHLPAALMLWLFRVWDKLTRRNLCRTEVALFERLAVALGGDRTALRGAAEAAVTVFSEAPRSKAATAFADASTPLMLCVGASAAFSGGAPLAQAVLRPDFFSPVLVHRRIAAAEIVLRLADQGIVVRNFRALLEIREADEILLDDGVEWDTSGLGPGEFGQRMAKLGLRETVLFRPARDEGRDDLAIRIGASRHFVRSAVHTPASYLAQQRLLGHRVIHLHAVHGAEPHAKSDVPIAVGPAALADSKAQIGLPGPDLARLCEIVAFVRRTEGEETSVKSMTVALNTVLIGACVYAGLSAIGVVAVGTLATAGLWLGLERRLGRVMTRRPGGRI